MTSRRIRESAGYNPFGLASRSMPLAPQTLLGPYLIVTRIGAGGMGEVYRARDTRLGRDVAVKVLPSDVAGDAERRARFEREARAVAALDHPHICGIYDVGEAAGTHYLVMPLLEGQTLAARLEKGPLPIVEALRVATEIADALDKAHRQGIVHRDLKPANVMLTASGVKLLDFGLAKLRPTREVVAISGGSRAATTTAGTAEGTILGTIHYMAPEQVEGRDADHRADLWALGAVTYEMVTGARPFQGDTAASVVGAILKDSPPVLSTRQVLSPPALDHIVSTCLEKHPDDRWQTARDLSREIRRVGATPVSPAPPLSVPASGGRLRAWVLPLAFLAVLGVAVWLGGFSRGPVETPVRDVRFSVYPEPGTTLGVLNGSVVAPTVTVSPDGRYVGFTAVSGGRVQLWVRDLRTTTSRLLPGTEDLRYHFWAPDSRSIAFTGRGKLKVVGLDGAPPVERATINSTARGGTWNRDGSITLNRSPDAGLFRLTPDGTTTPVSPGHSEGAPAPIDLFPFSLTDGRHVLFVHRNPDEKLRGLYISSVAGDQRTRLVDGAWAPIAIADTVLYLRGQALVAQRVDLETRRLVGEPAVILDRVANSTGGYMSASISETGTLAYAEPLPTAGEIAWYARDGSALGLPVAPVGDYVDVRLSPTGDQIAFSRVDGQSATSDVWLLDTARGVTTRFTSDSMLDASPSWTPDGKRLVFRSNRRGQNEFFVKDAAGAGPEAPLAERPDGVFGLVVFGEPAGGDRMVVTTSRESLDLMDIDLASKAARPLVQSPFDEYHAVLSPDSKWLAFTSDETGAPEVYVQSYPDGARRQKVSADGGSEPQWRGDGRELFFIRADRTLMAVPMRSDASSIVGTPMPLFPTRVPLLANAYRRQYAVTRDGQRFLVNNAPASARPLAIHVVLDWRALLPPEAREGR